jgi:uracil-DNA glycosylase family 4
MQFSTASKGSCVDGKEQLRRYLEQRREAGEHELVLDQMTVDEVLRLLGAGADTRSTRPGPDRPAVADVGGGDWRAVLRAADRGDTGTRAAPPMIPPPVRRSQPVSPSPVSQPLAAAESAPMARATNVPSRDEVSSVEGAVSINTPAATSGVTDPKWPPGFAVGQPHVEMFGGPQSRIESLEQLAEHIAACTQCPLHSTATNPVPGEGSPRAPLVCVGEAPGATEDATGRPFVGQAGKLLDKILAAIQLQRADVFICNVLKHRPPANRNPLPEEVTACSPYLVRQLDLIRPKVIIAFGTFAAQTLLQTRESIGKLRGAVHRYYGVPLIVTYHPAALLRNPAWKRPTWEDVQYARRILDGTGV